MKRGLYYDGVGIKFYWHNTAPVGAKALDKLVVYLWKFVLDKWIQEQANPDFVVLPNV